MHDKATIPARRAEERPSSPVLPAWIAEAPWMCRLRAATETTPRPSACPRVLSRALAELGVGPVRWAVESGLLLLADLSRVPGVDRPTVSIRSVETELLALLLQLRSDRDADEIEVSEALLGDARALARAGVPAAVLLETARRVQARVHDAMLALVMLSPGGDDETGGGRLWADLRRLGRYSEVAAEALLEAHEDESRAWSGGPADRRRDVVARLAAGDAMTAEDEQVVGVRCSAHHLVALVSEAGSDRAPEPDDPRLTAVARAVTRRIHGSTLVAAQLGAETVLWWSRARALGADEVASVLQTEVPAGLVAAFGDPHVGPGGVARGCAEARRASVVAETAGSSRPCRHGDVLLTSALLADPRATRDLVARELSGVLGADPRACDIRRTVLAYLRHDGSRQAVARELEIAPTTVAYRVERFERLRGRPLRASRLETWVALDVAERVPAVLERLSGSAG